MRRGGEDDELARIEWFGMKLRFRQSKTLFVVIPSRGLVTLDGCHVRIAYHGIYCCTRPKKLPFNETGHVKSLLVVAVRNQSPSAPDFQNANPSECRCSAGKDLIPRAIWTRVHIQSPGYFEARQNPRNRSGSAGFQFKCFARHRLEGVLLTKTLSRSTGGTSVSGSVYNHWESHYQNFSIKTLGSNHRAYAGECERPSSQHADLCGTSQTSLQNMYREAHRTPCDCGHWGCIAELVPRFLQAGRLQSVLLPECGWQRSAA